MSPLLIATALASEPDFRQHHQARLGSWLPAAPEPAAQPLGQGPGLALDVSLTALALGAGALAGQRYSHALGTAETMYALEDPIEAATLYDEEVVPSVWTARIAGGAALVLTTAATARWTRRVASRERSTAPVELVDAMPYAVEPPQEPGPIEVPTAQAPRTLGESEATHPQQPADAVFPPSSEELLQLAALEAQRTQSLLLAGAPEVPKVRESAPMLEGPSTARPLQPPPTRFEEGFSLDTNLSVGSPLQGGAVALGAGPAYGRHWLAAGIGYTDGFSWAAWYRAYLFNAYVGNNSHILPYAQAGWAPDARRRRDASLAGGPNLGAGVLVAGQAGGFELSWARELELGQEKAQHYWTVGWTAKWGAGF